MNRWLLNTGPGKVVCVYRASAVFDFQIAGPVRRPCIRQLQAVSEILNLCLTLDLGGRIRVHTQHCGRHNPSGNALVAHDNCRHVLPAILQGHSLVTDMFTRDCAGVSDTIRQGVADIERPDCWACGDCDSDMSLYMLGMLCALIATAVFLLLASYTAMPVSTTHAVVGAVVGSTIVGTKFACLNWEGLGRIAASWVASPLLSGVIGSLLYAALHRFIIAAQGESRLHRISTT
jgi:hypothetical protein